MAENFEENLRENLEILAPEDLEDPVVRRGMATLAQDSRTPEPIRERVRALMLPND